MANENWDRHVFNLPENHRWTAKPGNVVFVADRGALRFEIPQQWIVKPSKTSVKFTDAKPPNDDMCLEVSISYLTSAYGRNVDWSNLSLSEMLKQVAAEDDSGDGKAKNRKSTKNIGAPLTIKLGSLQMAWVETEFIDPGEKRPAYSRIGIALDTAAGIHAVLTMSFWPEDAARARTVWNDVFGTMKIGEYIASPFRGPDR